jgi:hypothetical protein
VDDDDMKVTLDLGIVAAQPGHWLCRLRRHRSAQWIHRAEPTREPPTWAAVAFCTTCDRDQTRVRLVLPDEPERHPDAVVLS